MKTKVRLVAQMVTGIILVWKLLSCLHQAIEGTIDVREQWLTISEIWAWSKTTKNAAAQQLRSHKSCHRKRHRKYRVRCKVPS